MALKALTNSDQRGVKQAPVRRINRSEISIAEYNPRSITKYAQQQLKKSLETFGLVETLVWNQKTGALVSGHQRLAILDKQHPAGNFSVDVSVVDLTPAQEKQLNVWLNNRTAQGRFEADRLAQMLAGQPDLTLDDIGFTRSDLELELGSVSAFSAIFDKENQAPASVTAVIAGEIPVAPTRKRRPRNLQPADANSEPEADYVVVVRFGSTDDKLAWLKAHGFQPTAKYLSHAEYSAACCADVERREVTQADADQAEATAHSGAPR